MNEEQFDELLDRAHRNEAPAEILAAVELEPGLVTRASGGSGETILHSASEGGHVDLARDSWSGMPMCINETNSGQTH